MRRWLRALERSALEAEIGGIGVEVPERYQSNFVRVAGAGEHVYILDRLITEHFPEGGPLRCLVVGVFGGRDYFYLKAKGHDVIGMDLQPVEGIADVRTCSAEDTWPFGSQEFDVVVMGEILEHLHHDMRALQEARRVLKPGGQLVATVPFLDSNDTYHIRIHDPVSFRRLLEINGFRVDHMLERPGFLNPGPLNYVVAGLATGVHAVTRKPIYGALVKMVGSMEWRLGHVNLPRRLMKAMGLINWGGTFSCSLSDVSFDYVQQNVDAFLGGSQAGNKAV